MTAGCFVLSNDVFDADLNDPIAAQLRTLQEGQTGLDKLAKAAQHPTVQLNSDDEDEEKDCKKDVPRDVHTKRVTFDPKVLLRSQYDEVEELARKMHSLDIADVSYSAFYTRLVCLAPTAAQAWATPSTQQLSTRNAQPRSHLAAVATLLCFMCGGPHLLQDCVCIEDYIHQGRIIRVNGYLTFTDGSRIRRHHVTNNLKGTVDEHYNQQTATPSATNTTSDLDENLHPTCQPPTFSF